LLTIRILATVKSVSAPPCSQSTFAKEVPYTDLEMIPDGMVERTNNSTNWNPKFPRGDMRFALKLKKYKNSKYGNKEA